jgi:hypothetical protein
VARIERALHAIGRIHGAMARCEAAVEALLGGAFKVDTVAGAFVARAR